MLCRTSDEEDIDEKIGWAGIWAELGGKEGPEWAASGSGLEVCPAVLSNL
jgi:hypothetical protein